MNPLSQISRQSRVGVRPNRCGDYLSGDLVGETSRMPSATPPCLISAQCTITTQCDVRPKSPGRRRRCPGSKATKQNRATRANVRMPDWPWLVAAALLGAAAALLLPLVLLLYVLKPFTKPPQHVDDSRDTPLTLPTLEELEESLLIDGERVEKKEIWKK
ncbi:hypothetical protein EVAR_67507_1 [Eumeta japonica]|uniref:Uncharacterized protein n=1 Tax=Eumeta variegata TaxID=151549 RepID=A0A4C2A1E4_EUMVA|nr:hypothetical protein EVAR_67507_1 [Eumeta japonica]